MKNSKLVFGLGAAMMALTAFTPKAINSSNPEGGTDKIEWKATKVIGDAHTGTIQLKENNLTFKKGELKGGSVIIDMTTITNTDMEGEWNAKLVGHLNSPDFFNTAEFSTATIMVKKVSKQADNTYLIVSTLTIKGIENEQTFTANIVEKNNQYVLTADLDIDRTKYDVRYGSTSFFDDLGDKAISDIFTIKVQVSTPVK